MTKDYAKIIENALKSCLPSTDCREKKLIDAMAYSLEAVSYTHLTLPTT